MPEYTLRNRLIAAFIGLAIVPLLVTGGLLGWHNYSLHLSDSYARQQQLAQRIAVQLTSFLQQFELRLEDADTLSDFAELDPPRQRQVLARLLAKQRPFREIWYRDIDNRERVRLSKVQLVAERAAPGSKEGEFYRSVLEGSQAYFGPIYYDPATGEPLMDVGLPVLDPVKGTAAGVLAAQVRVKVIWELIADLKLGPGEDVYILDTQQRIIAHRNPSVVLRETLSRIVPGKARQAGLSGEEAFIATQSVTVGRQSFTVVVERASSAALVPAMTGLKIVGGVTFFALVLALGLFYAALRRIVHPIQEVAAAARAIRDGDLDRRVAVTSDDEVGELARSFNSMTARLRHTLKELEEEVGERKQAEEQLRNTTRLLDSVVENMPDMLFLKNAGDLRFVLVNKAAEEGLGFKREQMLGKNVHDLYPGNQADLFTRDDREVLDSIEVRDIPEETAETPHQGTRILHTKKLALRDESGRATHLLGISEDITERKQAENALRELNAHLEDRVRQQTEENLLKERLMLQQSRHAAMGEMVSAIAHQWRQPLNALGLLLANIRDDYEFGELNRQSLDGSVSTGQKLIQKMSTTIDDFRNFFRIKETRETFDVGDAIGETVNLVAASLTNKNIRLELDCPAGIQAVGSANELGQVVLNLIMNAKDACLEKGIAEPFIFVGLAGDGKRIALTVEDNGGGVPPEVAERMFDPYFTTKDSGTGIGLYMARIIVERHMGGHIAFTNTDRGARFTVSFPATPPEAKETDPRKPVLFNSEGEG